MIFDLKYSVQPKAWRFHADNWVRIKSQVWIAHYLELYEQLAVTDNFTKNQLSIRFLPERNDIEKLKILEIHWFIEINRNISCQKFFVTKQFTWISSDSKFQFTLSLLLCNASKIEPIQTRQQYFTSWFLLVSVAFMKWINLIFCRM